MDRRKFLSRATSFLIGTFLGLQGVPKAFASEELEEENPLPCHIALIIDDIGFSVRRARDFLDLNIPITFAILPCVPHSHDLASLIHYEGHEIMLHQPMEPHNPEIDPGPGALYVEDRESRIIRVMEENISSLPIAIGVNNHMGSRFTAYEKGMNEVLNVVKGRGLFFVDSLTTRRSTAYQVAKSLHMATAHRNIFLDNFRDEAYILRQLQKLKGHALHYGRAIGIGHPFLETANAIQQFIAGLEDSKISFVHVSQVLNIWHV
jgi:polysaccharide deacetylase 2 family uncharacterized protein YibQ